MLCSPISTSSAPFAAPGQSIMGKRGTFKYVYIPADASEPLQERSLDYTEEDEVQCLLHTLRVSPQNAPDYACVFLRLNDVRLSKHRTMHRPLLLEQVSFHEYSGACSLTTASGQGTPSSLNPTKMCHDEKRTHAKYTTAWQEHFRESKPAKTAEQRKRQQDQLLANVPEEQRAQIDEKMLGAATGAFLPISTT